ncbi:MAG: hypothetical protein QM742_15595 [Aquabacterium sp.]
MILPFCGSGPAEGFRSVDVWHFATYSRGMPQSIRISDQLYGLAETASGVACRSLAQQLEYWARLGAALDAAGLTSEEAVRLLAGDIGLKAQVLAALSGSVQAVPVAQRVSRSQNAIATRHAKDEKAVKGGRRSADSLLVVPEAMIRRATFTFPKEPTSKGGW